MAYKKIQLHTVTALREILEDDMNALVCTDAELFLLLNDCLPKEDRVSYRTYQRYKQQAIQLGEDNVNFKDIDPLYAEFYRHIRLSQIVQKKALMIKLLDSEKQEWLRYKWVLERKFKDFRPNAAPLGKGKVDEEFQHLPPIPPSFHFTSFDPPDAPYLEEWKEWENCNPTDPSKPPTPEGWPLNYEDPLAPKDVLPEHIPYHPYYKRKTVKYLMKMGDTIDFGDGKDWTKGFTWD